MEQLAAMPDPGTLLNEVQFQRAADDLTAALQAAIELAVPMSKPSPHSCRWWNEDLSWLKKDMNRLGGASYKYRAIADHLSHSQYKEIWNKYGLAIKQAKKQHSGRAQQQGPLPNDMQPGRWVMAGKPASPR